MRAVQLVKQGESPTVVARILGVAPCLGPSVATVGTPSEWSACQTGPRSSSPHARSAIASLANLAPPRGGGTRLAESIVDRAAGDDPDRATLWHPVPPGACT